MKIGVILRCHNMKTVSGHMMTGMFLWLYLMIGEEYMLGCWMDEYSCTFDSSAFHEVHDDL